MCTAAGLSSCHEPIRAEEALDRLRLGMHVMVREGSVRRELAEMAKLKDAGADLRRLCLVSDGLSPDGLLKDGYMESVVQKAIDYGFRPEDALRMVTLNIAEHFPLDHHIGAIAPAEARISSSFRISGPLRRKWLSAGAKLSPGTGNPLSGPDPMCFPKPPKTASGCRGPWLLRILAFQLKQAADPSTSA
ncbi:MAG: amidohydrolase family protein [Desulfobacterales bacterium]